MKPHLNIQVCLYPFFDAGLYWNWQGFRSAGGPCLRLGACLVELRFAYGPVWWCRVSNNVPVAGGFGAGAQMGYKGQFQGGGGLGSEGPEPR